MGEKAGKRSTARPGGSDRRQRSELQRNKDSRKCGGENLSGATGGETASGVWAEKRWTTRAGGANGDREWGWRVTSIAGDACRRGLGGVTTARAVG